MEVWLTYYYVDKERRVKMLFKLLLFLCINLSVLSAEGKKEYFVYNCNEGYHFVAEVQTAEAWLFLPNKTLKLLRDDNEHQTYSAEGVSYRYKGAEADLSMAKNSYHCQNDGIAATFERAKFEGVAFRAIGNEPGWILNIMPDNKVVFITNLGKDKIHFKVEKQVSDKNSIEYRLRSNHNLLFLRIESRVCKDTMADREYESSVYLNFDGNELRGCGKGLF